MRGRGKILLSVPAETATGGIKNYFRALKNKFTLPVEYIERGARNWPFRRGVIPETKRFLSDILLFRKKIRSKEYAIMQTSTSLGFYSVFRDGIFLKIAQANGVKTIVFFRGWEKSFEEMIEKKYMSLFRRIFFKADLLIVLSPDFKDVLRKWGYMKEIVVETTLIDSALIRHLDMEAHLCKKQEKDPKEVNILFLARTEIDKGIYETINAYGIAKNELPDYKLSLTIAGNGIEFEDMKNYVARTGFANMKVLGNVDGAEKTAAFENADIYLFPTYTEGMPNSVLEAMAFGLPVIAGAAGAIPYIIKDGINGYVTDSSDPSILASMLQKLICNKELRMKMARTNFLKAQDEFYSDKVVKRMEEIYKKVLSEK